MNELEQNKLRIVGDEEEGVHICTPFCPRCGNRLVAQGRLHFYNAHLSVEGWEDGDQETDEVEGYCQYCYCGIYMVWCYGGEEDCVDDEGESRIVVSPVDEDGEYVD